MKQDNDKLTRILDTATELFARQPFHKVLLSDVARAASVGKGTLYLYFKSKDDLYFGVLFRGFSALVEKMHAFIETEGMPADKKLKGAIQILTEHLFRKAVNVEMLGRVMTCPVSGEWHDKRQELWQLIQGIIDQGIAEGVFTDSNSRLTAQYITALLRSVCLYKPENETFESIADHACAFVLRGLTGKA